LRRDLELTDTQADYLEQLAVDADGHPNDFDKRKASGMAHMRFTLSGVLSLRDRAERDLEAAFALDPTDRQLTRSLGRFYNLRAVAGDDSKAGTQVEVYRALLGDTPPGQLDTRGFVAWSFSQLGVILSHRNRGAVLKAYGVVKDLERELDARARAHPEDIELWALAGNFAFFFAGNVPLQRKDRVEAAVGYFTHVRAHWDELRSGARDPDDCPNTRENFMFELAEGHLALGHLDEARALYAELAEIRPPRTRAKEQIAFVASERRRNAEHYAGDLDLMPPWPSDVGNCVVCHAYTADVPLTTLHTRESITLDAIPTDAVPKPVAPMGPVPAEVRELVERRCAPCHFRGGEAQPLADFATDEGLLARARAVVRRVEAEEMPPNAALPPEERRILATWLAQP
jgi:tetratricopeptide (TPR) repeat protein